MSTIIYGKKLGVEVRKYLCIELVNNKKRKTCSIDSNGVVFERNCPVCGLPLFEHGLIVKVTKERTQHKHHGTKREQVLVYYMLLALRILAVSICYSQGNATITQTQVKSRHRWFATFFSSLRIKLQRLMCSGGQIWQAGRSSRKRSSSYYSFSLASSILEHLKTANSIVSSINTNNGIQATASQSVMLLHELDEAYFVLYYYGFLTVSGNTCVITQKLKGNHNRSLSHQCLNHKAYTMPNPAMHLEYVSCGLGGNHYDIKNFVQKQISDPGIQCRLKEFLSEANTDEKRSKNPLLYLWAFYLKESIQIFNNHRKDGASRIETGYDFTENDIGWTGQSPAPKCKSLALKAWRNYCRDWPARIFAYAVPTDKAINCIFDFASKSKGDKNPRAIIEVGAGTGYWAWMMRRKQKELPQFRKIAILALDCSPTDRSRNEYHGHVPPFTPVQVGGPNTMILSTWKRSTLFLCYPPPDSNMALDTLKAFVGEYVIHVGEFLGTTANLSFEILLTNNYQLVHTVDIPQFGNTANSLTVWKKKHHGSSKISAHHLAYSMHPFFKCASAKCLSALGSAKMRRCAYTRTMCVCSRKCAMQVEKQWQSELTCRIVAATGNLYDEANSVALKWPYRSSDIAGDGVHQSRSYRADQGEANRTGLSDSNNASSDILKNAKGNHVNDCKEADVKLVSSTLHETPSLATVRAAASTSCPEKRSSNHRAESNEKSRGDNNVCVDDRSNAERNRIQNKKKRKIIGRVDVNGPIRRRKHERKKQKQKRNRHKGKEIVVVKL